MLLRWFVLSLFVGFCVKSVGVLLWCMCCYVNFVGGWVCCYFFNGILGALFIVHGLFFCVGCVFYFLLCGFL